MTTVRPDRLSRSRMACKACRPLITGMSSSKRTTSNDFALQSVQSFLAIGHGNHVVATPLKLMRGQHANFALIVRKKDTHAGYFLGGNALA